VDGNIVRRLGLQLVIGELEVFEILLVVDSVSRMTMDEGGSVPCSGKPTWVGDTDPLELSMAILVIVGLVICDWLRLRESGNQEICRVTENCSLHQILTATVYIRSEHFDDGVAGPELTGRKR
jgi:hypothetical protein